MNFFKFFGIRKERKEKKEKKIHEQYKREKTEILTKRLNKEVLELKGNVEDITQDMKEGGISSFRLIVRDVLHNKRMILAAMKEIEQKMGSLEKTSLLDDHVQVSLLDNNLQVIEECFLLLRKAEGIIMNSSSLIKNEKERKKA